MKTMRDIINEAEGNVLGEPLEGRSSTNARIVMGFFPTIDNEEYFLRGWRKIVQNNEEQLNRWELEQMGKAFVSLVRMGQQDTMKVMRRLMLVHTDADGSIPADDAEFRSVNGPTPGLKNV